MVSIRRCYMPHNSNEDVFIARNISWPRNFSSWRYQLATKIMRWGYAKVKRGHYIQKTITVWCALWSLDGVIGLYFFYDATCHTNRANMALWKDSFPGDINWPPRSCDLRPKHFFFFGLRERPCLCK